MERKLNGLISSDSSCIISMSLRQCFGIHRTHAIPILTGNSRSSIEIIACKCTLGRYRLKTGVSYKWQGYMNVLPIYNWFLYHFFPVNYLTTRSLVPRSSGTCAKNKRTLQKSRHCNNGGRSRPYWFWLLCTVYFEILSRFMCNILVFTEYSILLFGLQRHRGKEKRERERFVSKLHVLSRNFYS